MVCLPDFCLLSKSSPTLYTIPGTWPVWVLLTRSLTFWTRAQPLELRSPATKTPNPPTIICRDLAGLGVIDPLLDLLDKGTEPGRKGAARALARMAEEPAVADKMAAPGERQRFTACAAFNHACCATACMAEKPAVADKMAVPGEHGGMAAGAS